MSSDAPAAAPAQPEASLAHFPVPLFASVMGMGGLAAAWREAGHVLGAPAIIGELLAAATVLLFLVVAGTYGLKALRFTKALRGEMHHPIRAPFFSTISIAAMLVAACILPYARGLSAALWLAAVALHLVLAVWVLRRWITVSMETHMATPAWVIPLVGNILAPILGAKLGFVETSWALFGLGFFLWLVFMPILVNRLVFHPELPPKLWPTLAVFIAPPAVGYIAYNGLVGGEDALSRALYWVAAFFFAFLVSLAPRLAKLPFAISWWAYTFPLAAFSIATTKFLGGGAAWAALAIASGVVALVALRTFQYASAGHLLRPE